MGLPLRIVRQLCGFTQVELGKRSDMSQGFIHLVEAGHRVASENQKARIAAALMVSVDEIDWPQKAPAEEQPE